MEKNIFPQFLPNFPKDVQKFMFEFASRFVCEYEYQPLYEHSVSCEWVAFFHLSFAGYHVDLLFDHDSNITVFSDSEQIPFKIEEVICEVIKKNHLNVHIECADLNQECNWDHYKRRALEISML